MKQVGEFWLPDIDLRWWSHWGKTRRKTLARYGQGGPKTGDIEAALAHIPRGGLAIDGGANVGVYSRIMARHFDRVIAFEPAPDTHACLVRNLADWGLAGRVEARAQALSDRAESVAMKGRRGHRSLSRQVQGKGDIPAVRIDDLDLPQLAFLKLDLEGYEARALRGAAATLARCRPFVLFEDKPHKAEAQGTKGEAHDILLAAGARLIERIGVRGNDWLYGFKPLA
ncbi:MAG: FkbM family methyltransferase [Pseudomonadales bacterium]|nr:FkbM family methyltransferase [Pseudomonadales bacterium]